MKRRTFKCKLFDKRLMSDILEEQINKFFEENEDIDIEYISKDSDSVIIIYK
jgi:hypothetical protein